MRSAISRVAKLAALTPRELFTLLVAAVALRAARPLLRRHGLQGLQAELARRPRPRPLPPDADDQTASISRVVAVAAKFGPAKPNCLARSVVLWWLLHRRGLPSEVRIGVRRNRTGPGMEFHAWVEQDGEVLNDAPDIRDQFATFDRAIVPTGARFR